MGGWRAGLCALDQGGLNGAAPRSKARISTVAVGRRLGRIGVHRLMDQRMRRCAGEVGEEDVPILAGKRHMAMTMSVPHRWRDPPTAKPW
jgi:hypothetical protein